MSNISSDFPTRQPAPKIGSNGNWLEWDELTQAYVDTGRPSRGDSAGLSDDIKTALLTLAQKAAYVDEHGQDYYDALYAALYPPAELLSITASFAQGSHVVYDTDSLDSLKPYLTVTGAYDDGTSRTITSYTLSGTLTEGTSTITVTASGKTAAFTVNVTHRIPVVTGIHVDFNQGSAVVYSNQSLDSLRQYLTVTAMYDTGAVAPTNDYTLSGTLTVGTSTITVTCNGYTDVFSVSVTEAVAALVSISAVFTQGDSVVYDTDSLDTLKQYLVVTAHYDDSTDVAVSDYTLSGTLTAGTSAITVSYGGKTTTFSVTVTHDTTAKLASEGKIFVHISASPEYREVPCTNGGITILYQMDTPTTVLYPAGIIPTDAISSMKNATSVACLFVYDENDEPFNFVNELTTSAFNRWVQNQGGTMTEFSQSWNISASYYKIAFSVDMRYLDDAYMYDKTTGQVWFAGKNTPYFGMTNISEAGGV